MSAHTTEIKRGRKFDQVIDGARAVFLRDGFEGASVDDIAREAGVSKATLYSYFPDKRMLFIEIALHETQVQADAFKERMDIDVPPDVFLPAVGRKILDFVLSDFGQAVHRIAMSEGARFPEIGHKFYESGPLLIRRRLGEYFEHWIAKGVLKIDDLDLAADQFSELCKSRALITCTFLPACQFSEGEKETIVSHAVAMFLNYYGRGD